MLRTILKGHTRYVLVASAAVGAGSFIMCNEFTALCEEKKLVGEKHNSWGLQLPDMPWAHRIVGTDDNYEAQNQLPVENAILTTAPNVPPPITRRHPVLLKVDLTTELKTIQLTSRYKYEAW
jgi:hypothetical protein